MKNLLLIVLICLPLVASSQNFELNKEAKQELKKLEFLIGEWKGKGWMMNQSREKMSFDQTEKVTLKLGGTALLIEGQGEANGQNVHNALAIVKMGKENGKYDFHSYLQSNQHGTYESELVGEVFYWYPTNNVRYVIKINEKGQWYEIGEANAGGTWYQFMEMTLDKVSN
ncbi:hypothetical protein LZF95_10200 [Algoriphagus sp. AGSA1]|uniref:hypothetical protein n=1 Tax=Algoriphagus sp. AGSA1 TaxID=2907213 RepID=UPI001F2F4A1F|nr:hypothetical protein [Algoriphagus sp. AGSA1]MCE7055045.1 hypothetical protein [Algoriphagus sp. AGSA1]